MLAAFARVLPLRFYFSRFISGPPTFSLSVFTGGCGFFGSPQLMFFCSVCFRKTHGEEEFKRRTTLQAEKKDHESAASSSTQALAAKATNKVGCSFTSSG
jgi:hypothetical protein